MGLGIVLVAFGALGLVPIGTMFEWVASLACPVMLIPMLLRLNLYTQEEWTTTRTPHEPRVRELAPRASGVR